MTKRIFVLVAAIAMGLSLTSGANAARKKAGKQIKAQASSANKICRKFGDGLKITVCVDGAAKAPSKKDYKKTIKTIKQLAKAYRAKARQLAKAGKLLTTGEEEMVCDYGEGYFEPVDDSSYAGTDDESYDYSMSDETSYDTSESDSYDYSMSDETSYDTSESDSYDYSMSDETTYSEFMMGMDDSDSGYCPSPDNAPCTDYIVNYVGYNESACVEWKYVDDGVDDGPDNSANYDDITCELYCDEDMDNMEDPDPCPTYLNEWAGYSDYESYAECHYDGDIDDHSVNCLYCDANNDDVEDDEPCNSIVDDYYGYDSSSCTNWQYDYTGDPSGGVHCADDMYGYYY